VWRCAACGRRDTFGFDALERFVRDGWPVCCGETVLAFLAVCEPVEVPRPTHRAGEAGPYGLTDRSGVDESAGPPRPRKT